MASRRSSNRFSAIADLDRLLDELGIVLAPVDAGQARLALQARIRFGRGMGHGGALNYGDSFAYALAKTRDAPLLFVGDDFRGTDVAIALDTATR
jgi:ribonuclease VapC